MVTALATEPPQRAGRREWVGLAVLALPALLLSLDISVLLLALPELSADLGASATQQLWIADIYGFMIAGLLVTMGTLGDRIGRRRLLLTGAAAFGAASAIAAYAGSPEMLIVMRALLGIAAATVMPSTLALISNMFRDPKQQAVAMACAFSCFMAGGALGPVVGGVLLQWFWWGSVFLLGVPVMLVLLTVGPRVLPEYRNHAAGKLDVRSVVLSLVAILPVVYGVKELSRDGLTTLPLLAIGVGVFSGVVFVRRQRRLTDPVLDVGLFRSRPFTVAISVMLFGGVVMGGIFLVITQYLQLVEGLSPLAAGVWMLPATVAMIIGVMIAPKLAQRARPGHVMALGLVISAIGYLIMTVAGLGSLALLVCGLVIALFGSGLPGGLGIGMIVGTAPPERTGSAASASETGQELGLALSFAVLGSLAAVVYRQSIAHSVPAEFAATAQQSVQAAITKAEASLATETLLDATYAAFGDSLVVVCGVSALLSAVLAALCLVALRHVRPTGE